MQPAPPRPRAAVGRHREHRPAAERRVRRGHRRPPAAQRAELAAQGRRRGLLADVAAGRLAISHEALDAALTGGPPTTCGTCSPPPGRCRPATRNSPAPGNGSHESWRRSSPAADRRLVQAYATWQVMRRLRASAAAAARPRTPTAHARNNIRAAASLLAWLRGRGTKLAACGQADIDQWLRTGPSACLARDFLAWAASPRPLPAAGHPRPAARDRPRHQPGPAVGADRPAAARHRARPHRPGRRVPAPALRPAAVPHRRHDHQPGHPPRRRDVHPARPPRRACPRPARQRRPSS